MSLPTADRPDRRITIGLLWHSCNSENLGVGALTVSNLAILDEAAAALGVTPSYIAIGSADTGATYVDRPDVEIVGLRNKDFLQPSGLWSVLRRCDLVLDIGGGDSFADIYGRRRLIWMFASKAMAMVAGKTLVLSPQTIGPFEKPINRRIAAMLMNRAALTVTRDALSTAYLDRLNMTGRRMEATDVALRLPYDAPAPRTPDGKVRVGINVSGLLFNGGYTRSNMFGLKSDYPALIHGLIADLTARPEVELHFVGHVVSERLQIEDDHRVCVQLAEQTPGAVCAPFFRSPSEAKAYIAGLDFFMGARMHACIAAFSSGVPVVPMAYSRKFEGLFGTLGYDALTDCKAQDAETIRATIMAAYDDRDALARKAASCLATGLERLKVYEREVSRLMDETAR